MLRHHLDDATHTLSDTLQYTYLLRRLEPKQHLHLHDLYMKFCEFREKIRNRCSRTKRNASTQYAHCRSVFIGAREGCNRAEVECEIIEAPPIIFRSDVANHSSVRCTCDASPGGGPTVQLRDVRQCVEDCAHSVWRTSAFTRN